MWNILGIVAVIGAWGLFFKVRDDHRHEQSRNIKPSWGEEDGGFSYHEDLDMSIRDDD